MVELPETEVELGSKWQRTIPPIYLSGYIGYYKPVLFLWNQGSRSFSEYNAQFKP
jgi:hypothetical protein